MMMYHHNVTDHFAQIRIDRRNILFSWSESLDANLCLHQEFLNADLRTRLLTASLKVHVYVYRLKIIDRDKNFIYY